MHFPLVLLAALLAQGTPATSPPDALSLLNDVAQRYAQAKSYHIEASEERTFSNELSRNWEKILLTAIVAPEGRYRYEGRGGNGAAILVSNGTTKWTYHVDEHLYTSGPASETSPSRRRTIPQEEFAVQGAKRLIVEIRSVASRLKSATLLPDEQLLFNGRSVDCYVVRFTDADFKTNRPDFKTEETIWVAKDRKVIVKRASRSDSYSNLPGSKARIPILVERTTVYPITELDQKQSESAFMFMPPEGAELVASFPDPFARQAPDTQVAEWVGKPAPEVQMKGSDGKVTSLGAFRGKPVFIEFWATSCIPCIELIPDLKRLHAETADKGLIWISVDNDEDPDIALKFVANEQIQWRNYHDTDGVLGKAFGREGIPLGVLIGADGLIKFHSTGYDVTELRAAIAKLGPEFGTTTSTK